MDIQAQVLGVTPGTTSTGKQKWTIAFSNGQQITAWDYAIANKAQQAVGTGLPVTARIKEKPNPNGGTYKNLSAVFHAGEVVPADLSPQPVQGGQFTPQTLSAPQGANGGLTAAPADNAPPRIARSVAVEHLPGLIAAGIFDVEDGPKLLLDTLSYWIYSGSWDGPVREPAVAPVVATEPQAVAAFVAAEAGKPLVAVGTEAVTPPQAPAALPWTEA